MLYRRSVRPFFQDPYGALNPRMRIGDVVTEPWPSWLTHGIPVSNACKRLLRAVGLSADSARRFPHELAVASVNVLDRAALVLPAAPGGAGRARLLARCLHPFADPHLLKDLQGEFGFPIS